MSAGSNNECCQLFSLPSSDEILGMVPGSRCLMLLKGGFLTACCQPGGKKGKTWSS